MDKIKVRMVKDKETTHTHRFREVETDHIETLYVKKAVMPKAPKTIVVTVEAAPDETA